MTATTATDAITTVLDLRTGQTFTLNGRSYTRFGYEGTTGGADARGEYLQVSVPAKNGGYRFVTVRPTSRITVA